MRTKYNIRRKPDLILTADLHVRETTPVCRTSSFLNDMICKLNWVKELSEMLEAPVLSAGDIFDTWKCKDWWLVNIASKYLPERFICVAGQHELPRHSLELPERSPLNILHQLERIHLLQKNEVLIHPIEKNFLLGIVGRSYGQKELPIPPEDCDVNILLTHEMVWDNKKPFPGAESSGNVKSVMKRYSDFDLIVSGDHHRPFVVKKKGQLLVNCGSMMRSSIDQKNHQPKVWLYYAKENEVEPLNYPTTKNCFVEYETVLDDKDERIQAVVKRIQEGLDTDISFEDNVEKYLSSNRVRKRTKEIILEIIER